MIEMRNKFCAILLVVCSSVVYAQQYSVGDELFVIANGGLHIRKEGSLDGEKIALLDNGSKVRVIQTPDTENLILPNGYRGKWVWVSSGITKGYVFDAYLSRLCPISFLELDQLGCWNNDILKDWANKIGKLDSFEYKTYKDTEGLSRMMIYKLRTEAKYIEHYFWEHFENEIQLPGLSMEEMDQFVKSIFSFCKDKGKSFDFANPDKNILVEIEKHQDCCVDYLSISFVDNMLIIKTKIDPGS